MTRGHLLLFVFLVSVAVPVVSAHGGGPHTFDTGEMHRGFSAEFVFTEETTIRFECMYHPATMHGTFLVSDDNTLKGTVPVDLIDQRLRYEGNTTEDLELRVKPGAILQVVNREDVPHRLMQLPEEEESPSLAPVALVLGIVLVIASMRPRDR